MINKRLNMKFCHNRILNIVLAVSFAFLVVSSAVGLFGMSPVEAVVFTDGTDSGTDGTDGTDSPVDESLYPYRFSFSSEDFYYSSDSEYIRHTYDVSFYSKYPVCVIYNNSIVFKVYNPETQQLMSIASSSDYVSIVDCNHFAYDQNGETKASQMWTKTNFFVSSISPYHDGQYITWSCNVYTFGSTDAAIAFFRDGDESGVLKEPEIDINDAVLNEEIERPIIVRDAQNDIITFSNSSEDLFLEVQGRWYSTDDFTLYKEDLMWKYKYDSLIKGSLSDWISVNSRCSSIGNFDLLSLGADSFNNLLISYPIDDRSFSGGTNSFGNVFSGYNDALSQLKLLLGNSSSSFNGYEIYARYYYISDDGTVYKSKWTHFYNTMADPAGSSGSSLDDPDSISNDNQSQDGLTDDEKDDVESGNSRDDPDVVPKFDLDAEWNSLIEQIIGSIENIFSMFKRLFSLMGSFPSLVAQVFGFLPAWFINFLSISLALVVLLRIVGR